MNVAPYSTNWDFETMLPGYDIDQAIFYGNSTSIFKAIKKEDGTPVILKVLYHSGAGPDALSFFKHEYEVLRNLDSPFVIRALSFHRLLTASVIEMEDFGGESLDNIIRKNVMSVTDILNVAVSITDALSDIHKANIIHKDINPSNIVFNTETRTLKIIDFGISTYVTKEQAAVTSPQMFEGSLPFISPEQTGRMNRSIDYRTDFYSLGATLFILLTRQPLCLIKDPMEWLHFHIAKQPVPPDRINPAVPPMLSAIVLKLLSKTAEDRYQSAQGIKADLLQCIRDLKEEGSVHTFPLARHDRSDRFQIPQRLYGRDKEVRQLLSGFDQVSQGTSKLILVSGYAGIGKTRLIREIYKPVTEKKGYFASGKFDQLNRNIPYYAMTAALRDLVRQLLTEPEDQLSSWREGICNALGHNGRLIVDIIQELELIIGPQPQVPDLPPLETEQRFHFVFQHFVQVFSTSGHPLVLFLDDLQWADRASMDLIDLLTDEDTGVPYLLLIGAFRDNALSENQSVEHWLKNLQEKNSSHATIHLTPLSETHLTELLSDTLMVDRATAAPLADIVKRKTEGNPFFSEEFLKTLFTEGRISYSPETNTWSWDLDRIRNQQYTDNVVDLMTFKLNKLPEETLRMIRLGACIGFVFSLKDLALVSKESFSHVAVCLRPVINDGLIFLVGNTSILFELDENHIPEDLTMEFSFVHDRVHQAAYALLSDDRKKQAHLAIGRLLKSHLTGEKYQAKQFEIAYHLNMGSSLMDDPEERFALCRLNVDAGHQAKRSNAFQPAFEYFSKAIGLLPSDAWETHYEFTMALHTDAAEAAYLIVNYPVMDDLLSTCLSQAKNVLDQVKPNLVKISACMATGELLKAIGIGKQAMKNLGQKLPSNPKSYHILIDLLRVKWMIRNKTIEDWRNLPTMTDPQSIAIMKIGSQIGGASMFARPNFLPLLVFVGMKLAVKHGHCAEVFMGYTAMGMVFSAICNDVERGEAFGKLGLEMARRHSIKTLEGRISHIYYAMVYHWSGPLGNTLGPLHETFLMSLEYGDFEYAAHTAGVRSACIFDAGTKLEDVLSEINAEHKALRPLKQGPRNHYLENVMQLADNLMGNAEEPAHLKGRFYDIDKKIPEHENFKDKGLLFFDYSSAAYLAYMFGQKKRALDYVNIIRMNHSDTLQGMYILVQNFFIDSLIRLANSENAGFLKRRKLIFQVAVDLFRFKRWSRHNPNIRNKLRLIQAERLRILGKTFKAHDAYEQSSILAREQGFIHEEALALELCGIMHMKQGSTTMGMPYLEKARDLYMKWGARAKVDHLHNLYPNLIPPMEKKESTDSFAMAQMDLGSLMKALRTIARVTIHSRMVEIIIQTAMEFAGAQLGFLILRNPDGKLHIEAESSVDGGNPRILQSIPVNQSDICQSVVNYVSRTKTSIVIHDARQFCEHIPGLENDGYIIRNHVLSLLCLPILSGSTDASELIGILYLENNRATGVFTQHRLETLEIICLSAAGRLELSRKAAVDGLTGLYNHDHFQNILGQEFNSAKRHSHYLSLILLDIDHFKRFNDTWGHQVGDLVLKEVAQVLKESCRSGDIVARYGGEEMVVVLPMTPVSDAKMVAERIRKNIESLKIPHSSGDLNVTVSLGVSTMETATQSKDDLIRKTDDALYKSKAAGRNCLTVN